MRSVPIQRYQFLARFPVGFLIVKGIRRIGSIAFSHLPRIRKVASKMIGKLFIDGNSNATNVGIITIFVLGVKYVCSIGFLERRSPYPVTNIAEKTGNINTNITGNLLLQTDFIHDSTLSIQVGIAK